MTSREIALIQNSFRQLVHVSDQAGSIFFARLFELDPTFRLLFQGDLRVQSQQMVQTVRYFVTSLDQLPQTLTAMRQAGLNHAEEIPDAHFQHFCDAMLWTLSRNLGRGFTQEVRDAWAKAFWMLSEAMRVGNRDAMVRHDMAVA